MNLLFRPMHSKQLERIPFQALGPGGRPPLQWAIDHGLFDEVPRKAQLPDHQLDRITVRRLCIDTSIPPLYGYVCAMAWGGQGGQYGRAHINSSWAQSKDLRRILTRVRKGNMDRKEAFDLFRQDGGISGLGPAYYTKLLYFFSPKLNHYIMDQWTAKAVNLLAGLPVVRMSGDYVSGTNKGGNYLAFCREVEAIAKHLKCSGDQAEQRIYSMGGRYRWPWRKHVDHHWKKDSANQRYAAEKVKDRHPRIMLSDL